MNVLKKEIRIAKRITASSMKSMFLKAHEAIWRKMNTSFGTVQAHDGSKAWFDYQTLHVDGADWKICIDEFAKHFMDSFPNGEWIANSCREYSEFYDFAYGQGIDNPEEWFKEEWNENILAYGIPSNIIVLNGKETNAGNCFRNSQQWGIRM